MDGPFQSSRWQFDRIAYVIDSKFSHGGSCLERDDGILEEA
jgi:hypothetical protein